MPTSNARDQITVVTQRSRRGLTLIECLIATIILAIATMGTAAALSATYQQQAEGESYRDASELSQQLVERVVSLPYVAEVAVESKVADPSMRDRWEARFDGYVTREAGLSPETAASANDLKLYQDRLSLNGRTFVRRVVVDPAASVQGFNEMAGKIGVATIEIIPPTGSRIVVRRLLIAQGGS